MKKCTGCNTSKDETEFHNRGGKRIGLRSVCKECTNSENRIREHNYKNVAKVTPVEKRCPMCDTVFLASNFYKSDTRLDGLKAICKKCSSKLSISWAKNNPDKRDERTYRWRASHLENWINYCREYEAREEVLKRRKSYKRSERGLEVGRAGTQRRRNRVRNLPATLTYEEWNDILKAQDNKCLGCGREFSDKLRPEQDHIIPISKGGGYVKENIQALCRSCNASKGDKLVPFITIGDYKWI